MPPDTLVLVHGLGRTHRSMWGAAALARRRGYDVVNWGYPSRRRPIAEHAAALGRELTAALAARPGRVHFLTHSLGGIVVRAYLAARPLPNLGRVVMLAPPNGGSEVADALRGFAPFRWLTGRPGQELGTAPDSVPNRLPPADYEAGVIAGDAGANPVFGAWLGAPNDGKVAVARARLPGMRAFLVVRCGHTWLPWHPQALAAAFAFLATGEFPEAGADVPPSAARA